MRALGAVLTVAVLVMCMAAACGAGAPSPTDASGALTLPPPAEGWADGYLQFLDDCFDIFAALWPEGISGMGFIDLDLDGTPELVVFDQGASATMGVHLFDLLDDQVYCVSSGLDSAAGVFFPDHLSNVSLCGNYFESFRLSRTGNGWRFWIDSENGTMETAWDEIVRFDGEDGVLTPVSVCSRYLASDAQTGDIVEEDYIVGGTEVSKDGFQTAQDFYQGAPDSGYEARGVFRWNDLDAYDTTTYEGFLALAWAAVDAYVPITDTVEQAVIVP